MKNYDSLQDTAKLDKLIDEKLHPTIKNKNVKVSEDINFITHAHNNLWSDRRSRGMPWRMDVFQFILETYNPWLGNGIVQSDLKKVDPGLYAEFHKRLSSMRRENTSVPEWIEQKIPSEGTLRVKEFNNLDTATQEKVANFREILRGRVAASRARHRGGPEPKS